jgi:hypothetical protein
MALRLHRAIGSAILALALAHVFSLWLYSPEDIMDALLLVAPTPFSVWGVAGLGGLLAAGAVMALALRLPRRILIPLHVGLAGTGAVCAALHAWLIEGAMETITKALLCTAVCTAVAVTAALASRRGLRASR